MLRMQRNAKLQESIDRWRERIQVMENEMKGIDREKMKVETLKPIAAQFEKLIFDVMGKDSYEKPDWKWNFNYVLDYDKVLDYVMYRDSRLTSLEISGLFMLEIPLDIIDAWIKFVRILCDFSSWVAPPEAKKVNNYLDVVESTVNVMRRIILAAKAKSISPTYQNRNALSIYEHNIIPDVIEIITPFKKVQHSLIGFLYNKSFFRDIINTWVSFKYIESFVETTFIDKVEKRFKEIYRP